MVEFEDAISVLKDNAGFEPNKYEDSFYRLYNTRKGYIQVRVSNHGTELWTWVKNAPVDPSECYANICIALSDDGNHNSNTTTDMNRGSLGVGNLLRHLIGVGFLLHLPCLLIHIFGLPFHGHTEHRGLRLGSTLRTLGFLYLVLVPP